MSRHVGQDMDDVIRTLRAAIKKNRPNCTVCVNSQTIIQITTGQPFPQEASDATVCTSIFKFLKVMEVGATIQTANLSHRPI